MKRWNLTSPKKLELENSMSEPLESTGIVKVKIEMGVIAQTDIRIFNDPGELQLPFVPGRHGAGIVTEVFDEASSFFARGDKVVVEPFAPCGKCIFCKTKRHELCPNKNVLGVNVNGLYSDFVNLPAESIYKLPTSMSFETAIFAENVATAINVINKIDINKGDHVSILSGNKTANILAQLVIYYQGIPIVVDKDEDAIADLKGKGVEYAYLSSKKNIAEEVFNITGGRMCEKVVCFGDKMNTDFALSLAAHNGVACICGRINGESQMNIEPLSRKQVTLFTVNDGLGCFPTAINLLANKAVDVSSLIGKKIAFDDLFKEISLLDASELRYKYILINY